MSLKYRLSIIGWYNFELLVQTVLKAVIGPGTTAFGGSKDGGRDATFKGSANFPNDKTRWRGKWVFQVKYVDFEEQGIAAARASLRSTFTAEVVKLLKKHPNIDNYILLTNVPLAGANRDELEKIIADAGFSGQFASVDGKDLCQLLDIHSEIRRSYPQLLGLADLDIIINKDLYTRSRAFVEEWQPKLSTYVQTEAHRKALALVKKRYFVVLDGPPEVGKTTIAAALALTHVAEGFELIDIRNSNEIFKIRKKRPQIFIADDAVGSLSLDPVRADDWSRDLPGIMRELDNKHLLIWTARRYILEEALAESRLREAVSEFPGVHEILVEVGGLSTIEKAEILYNHAKHARLSQEHRKLIRKRAAEIVTHQDFRPERIRQLVEVILAPLNNDTREPNLEWKDILAFLNNPSERWIRAHAKLNASEQALLSAMLDFDDQVAVEDLKRSYESRTGDIEPKRLTFEHCLARLKHSFLKAGKSWNSKEIISVQHPSLRDMLLLQLREDLIARKRYISLASPLGLASIIGGIAASFDQDDQPQHAVVPQSDEEFELLLKGLRNLSRGALQLRDWELLLGMASKLIPAKPQQHRGLTEWEILLRGYDIERVEPHELDLEDFLRSWRGRIVSSLLDGFASQQTFDNSQRFGSDEWLRLLRRFYDLSAYSIPPIHLSFTRALCDKVQQTSIESVRLFTLIRKCEPLVARQKVSPSSVDLLKSVLAEEIADMVTQGEEFGQQDDPDEYDYWHNKATEVAETAQEFLESYGIQEIERLSHLNELLESVERPHDRTEDEKEDRDWTVPGDYWTVERIFEDL